MQTLTSNHSISDQPVTLIKLSVTCPICGWYYSGHLRFPEPPYCNDKQCTGCKTIFKVRYKLSSEVCDECNHKLRCLSMPVADVKENIQHAMLGDINWST